MVVLLVVFFVTVAITVTWIQGVRRHQALSASPIVKQETYKFKMENLSIPAGIYFSPTHSWAHMQSDGLAKIGVDAFLHGLTGILSEIQVPSRGVYIKQGEPLFNIIHQGKRLNISAPISGTVKSVNTEALQNMRLVHRDPYAAGWFVELEPSDWENETKRLFLGPRTTAWLSTEMARIRDFFAHSFAPADSENGLVLLQDGGDIAENALAYAGKGLWGSFQKLILDQANIELLPHS